MLRAMGRSFAGVLSLSLPLFAAAACVSETTPHLPEPLPVSLLERFRVMQGEDLVGYLLYQEIAGRRYYRIITPSGGWVGDATEALQFYKNEPFRDRPRFVGVFTMKEGLGVLFERDSGLTILPEEGRGEPTEASAHRILERAKARGR